jgi:hypothetical protein
MEFNAPGQDNWRPSKNTDDDQNCIVLTAEPSSNSANFLDGIIVSPHDDLAIVIGRVKRIASCVLAPLLREGKVTVRAIYSAGCLEP